MGAYDSIYARCNCDWPDDDRCKNLPDDQTRWFNHLLWLESVRQKSSVLPQRLDAAYWAKRLGASIERVEEMIQAMATEDLLAWTEFGELVIFGTRKNHQKLAWKQEEPEETINPFRKTSGWRFLRLSGDSSGYPVKKGGYPVKSPTVESRVEKSREEERREERSPAGAGGHPAPNQKPVPVYPADFDAFYAAYPKKINKPDAFKAWKQQSPDLPTVMASLEKWVKCHDWVKENKKYVPYPASWLRARGWEDEAPPQNRGPIRPGQLDLGPITPEQEESNNEVYESIKRQQREREEKRRLAKEAAPAAEGVTT